ncbi:MAG: cadherin-like domain-containing protein [Anaerolineae bacterium]|nr:cadherin-like domain-containing protein [Anaerolineae bacterium]
MNTRSRYRPLATIVNLLFVTMLVVGVSGLWPVRAIHAADSDLLGGHGLNDSAPPITTAQLYTDGHQASPQALESGFCDDFDSPTLDPAWQVVEFTGTRVYGYTSPANHISLADNPGHLRYYVDAMTYPWGFLNDYQVYVPYYNYDFGLELHRPFSGEHWRFETKADYYLPYNNGRGLNVHIYFGDGGANTFVVEFQRYRDVAGSSNSVGIGLLEKFGPTFADLTTLESYTIYEDIYGPPASTYFYRLERDGSILTASWSPDGVAWTQAFSRDMGSQLDGLEQRVVIVGLSWFNPVGSYADYDYACLAALPTVQFSSGDYSVVEDAGPALVTATLSAVSSLTVTVDYATTDGTAMTGSDYVTTSGTLTFTPGVTTQTFSVPILDDGIEEPAETVNLTLSGPLLAVLGTPVTAVLTIVDDNDAPVAANDAFTVTEDSQTNALAVLVNDSDPELSPLAVSAVGVPDQGGVAISAVTHINYTPATDFYGLETFTYTVSDGHGGYDSAMVAVTVTPVCDCAVELEPPAAAQTGDAGTTITYTLRLTNSGDCADVLDVTVVALWPAGAPATIGPLAAGAGTDVAVTVAIPAGAGNQDVATVTFTSQGDGSVSEASVLTTTANVPTYRVYLPLVLRGARFGGARGEND